MPAEYLFSFSVDTGILLPSLGRVLDEVSGHMADFGFPERLVARSNIITITLSGVRDLWPEEISNMAMELERELRKKLPRYDIRYEGCKKL